MSRRNSLRQHGVSRDRRIELRVSREEKQLIARVADHMGMSVAHATIELYRRSEGIQTERMREETSPQIEELRRIRSQIWHIGHNINQIARNTNRDMESTIADEQSAMNAARKCEQLIERIDSLITG